MSLILGYGESSLPNILGDSPVQIDTLEVNTITINDAMIVDGTTIYPDELAQLTGIHTNQTIQQQIDSLVETYADTGYWFSGWSTQDQVPAAANTPYYATLNSYDASSNEIILYDGSGGIYNAVKVLQKSVYNIQFSIQTSTTTSSKAEVRVWLRKNGTDIPDSGGEQSISTNDGNFIMSYNIILPLNANDYISLMWAVDDTNLHLEALPALTTPYNAAASPSVLITFQQVLNVIPGPAGDAATVDVGFTTTLSPGSSATVTNSGTSSAAVLNFGIPQGAAATVAVGSTTTLSPGSSASVTNSGTSNAAVLNFSIPQGAQGNPGAQGPQGPPGEVTTAEMTAAILLQAGLTEAAANLYTDTAITTLTTTVIDPLAADVALIDDAVTALEGKTALQTCNGTTTTSFQGILNVGSTLNPSMFSLNSATQTISGLNCNFAATVGSSSVTAPTVNITSTAGGGSINIGGFTDVVYVNGFPFLNFFQQYTP